MDIFETPRWPGGSTIVAEWDMETIVKTLRRQLDQIQQKDNEIAKLKSDLAIQSTILDALRKQLSSKDDQIFRLIDQVSRMIKTKDKSE